MKNKRTLGRNVAVQMMYSLELSENDSEMVIENFDREEAKIDEDTFNFAVELFRKSVNNISNDDEIISKFLSKNWTIDRIGLIEKNILRTAITELFYGDSPVYAILDDYVTLAKTYGDEKTASFINGVLESIRNKFEINRGYENEK